MMLIIFFSDKDGCQSSKLSASLGFFSQAMLQEHLNRLFLLVQGVFPVVLALRNHLVLFIICIPH